MCNVCVINVTCRKFVYLLYGRHISALVAGMWCIQSNTMRWWNRFQYPIFFSLFRAIMFWRRTKRLVVLYFFRALINNGRLILMLCFFFCCSSYLVSNNICCITWDDVYTEEANVMEENKKKNRNDIFSLVHLCCLVLSLYQILILITIV